METFKSLVENEKSVSIDNLKQISTLLSTNSDADNTHPATDTEEQLMNKFIIDNADAVKHCMQAAYNLINAKHLTGGINIIDWNCGQGLATVSFNDFIAGKCPEASIKSVKLIEPSGLLLDRAATVVKAACHIDDIKCINRPATDVIADNLRFAGGTVIHIFNNLLDREGLDFKNTVTRLTANSDCANIVVGCSPCYFQGNRRIKAFVNYLGNAAKEVKICRNKAGSESIFAFVIDSKHINNRYKPSYFGAAYMLECIGNNAKAVQQMYRWKNAEVYCPFFAESQISDDIHPLLAIANNIISRGLPTHASPGMEQTFAISFGLTHRTTSGNKLCYESNMDKASERELIQCLSRGLGKNAAINQLAFTPIEVARLHKVAIEAMISGRLDINAQYWNILIIENDVPCAAIAMRDLEELFGNIAKTTAEYSHLSLPQIRLDIISGEQYACSPLHLGYAPSTSLQKQHLRRTYDMVIETSIDRCGQKEPELPNLSARNSCIFSIYSANPRMPISKSIYTLNKISYDNTAGHGYLLSHLFKCFDANNDTNRAIGNALQGKPTMISTFDNSSGFMTAVAAAMLQPGLAIVASITETDTKIRCRNLQASGIDCCMLYKQMPSDAFESALASLEDSSVQFVSLQSQLLLDVDIMRRLSSLKRQRIFFSTIIICDAEAISIWSDNFSAIHRQVAATVRKHLAAPDEELNTIAVTQVMPQDVSDDIMSTLSPGNMPYNPENIVRTDCSCRSNLQFAIEQPTNTPYDTDETASVINDIDDFDAIQKSKIAYAGEYLHRLPLQLRLLQQGTVAASTMPDNYYLATKNRFEHAGVIFTRRNYAGEVEKGLEKNGIKALSLFTSEYEDNDDASLRFSEFIDNKAPLIIAQTGTTPCFDKPNIRFVINLCRPDSIEDLMASASVCGLDGQAALITTFFQNFGLARPTNDNIPEPIAFTKGHWINACAFESLCTKHGIDPAELQTEIFDPTHDLIRLNCAIDNDIFMSHLCNYCKERSNCTLLNSTNLPTGWIPADKYADYLSRNSIASHETANESLAQSYNIAMPAIDNKQHCMATCRNLLHKLLHTCTLSTENGNYANGLTELLSGMDTDKTAYAAISIDNNSDFENMEITATALCYLGIIGVVDEFHTDNARKQLLLQVSNKPEGFYCRRLLQLLLCHLPRHEAEDIASEACNCDSDCCEPENALSALLDFIERKSHAASERKLIDINDLCILATENKDCTDSNEYIKKYIHNYYNSPFLHDACGNEDDHDGNFLDIDTRHGRESSLDILCKYIRLMASLDNDRIQQLHGAVRRLLRLSTGNGTLSMLDALCMMSLHFDCSRLLYDRIADAYGKGYEQLRAQEHNAFHHRWNNEIKPLLHSCNPAISRQMATLTGYELRIELKAHNEWLNKFINRYGTGK